MAGKVLVDTYCERAVLYKALVYTLATWQGAALDLGISSRDMVAAVIHRIDLSYWAFGLGFDSSATLHWGLFGRDPDGAAIAAAVTQWNSCFVYHETQSHLTTSGSSQFGTQVLDFSSLPGGGLLVPARNLYVGGGCTVQGVDTAILAEIRYHIVELDQASMLDLIQALQGI